MPLLDSLGLFHNSCCALFSKLIEGMEEPGERGAEELEIVNRQLSSFILVDGSIYLLPLLSVRVCAPPSRRLHYLQPLDGIVKWKGKRVVFV